MAEHWYYRNCSILININDIKAIVFPNRWAHAQIFFKHDGDSVKISKKKRQGIIKNIGVQTMSRHRPRKRTAIDKIPLRLYDIDRNAYHKHVHEELISLGFNWRDCSIELSNGKIINRHYWR